LATVVIFGAGVLTGGLLVDITQRDLFAALHRNAAPATHPVAAPAAAIPSHPAETIDVSSPHPSDFYSHRLALMQKMDTALKLTPQQHNAIEKLIEEGQGQISKAMQDTFQNVRDQLTPEQRKKYEEMLKQFHQQPHPASPANTNGAAPSSRQPLPPVITNASVI
jgi:Spy/CpxP family protein refolding chaperone